VGKRKRRRRERLEFWKGDLTYAIPSFGERGGWMAPRQKEKEKRRLTFCWVEKIEHHAV